MPLHLFRADDLYLISLSLSFSFRRAFCLCRIFTEMAESFLYHLVNHPNSDLGDLSILSMLLECVGNHDYEVK